MFPIIITCGSPQREEIFFRKILGGGGGCLNFIKQNYTDFEEERLREKKGIQINIRSSSGIDHREKKKFFFFNNNNNNNNNIYLGGDI